MRVALARVHAFPFSERPGTAAAAMADPVAPVAIRDCMAALLDVARTSAAAFARSQVGSTVEVLWERRRDGEWAGTSDNYLRVRAPAGSDRNLRRRLAATRLLAADGPLLHGTAVA